MPSYTFRLFVLSLFLFSLISIAGADVVLTDAGQPKAAILTRPSPTVMIQKSAQEFQLHIQKMSGATLPIDVVGNENLYTDYNFVYIGQSTTTDAAGVNVSALEYEHFKIQTESTHAVYIVGRDGGSGSQRDNWYALSDCYPGTMFGVYYVLSDILGCKWLWPGDLGMSIPQNASVSIPNLSVTDGPYMVQRHYRIPRIGKCYTPSPWTDVYGSLSVPIIPADATRRTELAREEQLWLRRQRMGTRFDPPFAHYYGQWWNRFKDTHPEYFAILDNRNQPFPVVNGEYRVKLNDSLPAVWQQRVTDWVNSGAGNTLNVCPNDSKGFCVCQNCLDWDRPSQLPSVVCNTSNARLSDRYARHYSEIGKLVKAINPNAKVYGYAYDVYRHYPLEATVEDNVALAYIPGAPSDANIPDMDVLNEDVLGWIAAGCQSMYLRPNWMLSGHVGPNWPMGRAHEVFTTLTGSGNIIGFDSDSSNSSYACMGPYLYMVARLMTDVTLTIDDIRTEYCAAFGPAAPKVLEYLNYWENFLYSEVDSGNIAIEAWANCVPAYDDTYTAASFNGAEAILEQAYLLLGPSDTDAAAKLDFLSVGTTHGRLTAEAIALVNQSVPITQNPAAEAKMRELMAIRDENADSWTLWREWFIDREAAYVPGMSAYWDYVINNEGGGQSPLGAFIESNGLVVMEAEHYTSKEPGTGSYTTHQWQENLSVSGASGTTMQGLPNSGINTGNGTAGPRLDFKIQFTNTGAYYIFIRWPTHSGSDDTINVGLDNLVANASFGNTSGSWRWTKPANPINVLVPGVFTFNIWMREDGVITDKIILTTNSTYSLPGTDVGPAENPKNTAPVYALTVISGTGDGYYEQGAQVLITAEAAPGGMEFDQWTGDNEYITNAYTSPTTVMMPAEDITLEATWRATVIRYTLTVTSGSGDGQYTEGQVVPISADAPPAGQRFVQWTGDTQYVANVNTANTVVTMPAGNVAVRATYDMLPGYYMLTVTTGTGSGIYPIGQQIPIQANAPATGQIFAGWTGDIIHVDNPTSASAIVTMPAMNVSLSATYAAAYTLSVNYGSGDGLYAVGRRIQIVANPAPVGQAFSGWQGSIQHLDSPTSATTMVTMPANNVTVTAIYSQQPGIYLLSVTNGNGGGTYGASTVVPITADTPPPGQEFRQWTGDTATVENIYSSSTTVTMPASNVTLIGTFAYPSQDEFTLTVVSGTGDGLFEVGEVRPISADLPPPGERFLQWTGDTDVVADVNASDTTVTMPSRDVTVTANYVPSAGLYTLAVVSGSGDGSYAENAVVQIAADVPAVGQEFDQWTGDVSVVANVLSSTTTVTMPASNITVTATYRTAVAKYTLTVEGGTGDGEFVEGAQVEIVAEPPAGKAFLNWSGDTEHLADISAATTTVTMPASNVTVTAMYKSSVLEVLYPSGTTTIERGAKRTITWRAPGLDARALLRIELKKGSETWVLSEKAKAGTGRLAWTVGKWKSKTGQAVYPDGDDYTIRISTLDGVHEDASDNAFAIGTVTSLEIQGPSEVNENSSAQYACIAHFNFGQPVDITSGKVKWKSYSGVAKIQKGGLLQTYVVPIDTICTITAGYGKSLGYVEDAFDLTVKNR